MPIGPGQIAPTSARLQLGRVGAMRLRYALTVPSIVINNVDASRQIRVGSVTINDVLNDVPNTCEFVSNVQFTAGQDVRINWPNVPLLFAGAIERVTQLYEGDDPANKAWQITCQDYSRQLTRTVLNKTYAEQSASAIAADLLVGTGISPGGIVAGLPTVTGGIDFTDTTQRDALTKLAQRIGGYWYVDYTKVCHFFITDTTVAPDPLLEANPTRTLMVDPPVTYEEDITQLRTRIIVTGGGSQTLIPIAAGASVVPIEDATLFASSGLARTGTQRLAYTGKVAGGVATNVGSSIAAPASAPSAAISPTKVGKVVGAVSYKHSFKNASGETLVGPASNTVTGVEFQSPVGAPAVGIASGLGRLVGVYTYRYTNVTDRGETKPGPISSAVAANFFPTPSGVAINANGIGPLVGFYQYACTFVTPYGETSGGVVGGRTANPVNAPGSFSASTTSNDLGPLNGFYNYAVSLFTPYGETFGFSQSMTASPFGELSFVWGLTSFPSGPLIGNYSYKISYVSNYGETVSGSSLSLNCPIVTASGPAIIGDGTGQSIAYTTSYVHPVYGESNMSGRSIDTNKAVAPSVQVVNLPSGCGWNIFTTGTTSDPSGAPLFKIAEVPPGVFSFSHTNQTGPAVEATLGQMGRWIRVTNIPAGPNGTIARRIYRTRAGGSGYYLVGEIPHNVAGVSFDDVAPDGALTVTAPNQNLNGRQVLLQSIPTGPSGTGARRIWRSRSGGGNLYLVGVIFDNSTTAFLDAIPDVSLSTPQPVYVQQPGEQFLVTIPTGPFGTVARRVYRTQAGGGTFRLLTEIGDNGFVVQINDNVADAQLSPVSMPLTSTAGGENVQLTGIQLGPTGTLARRIYRTRAGGSEHLLVGQISDNTTTSYVDSVPDGSLGKTIPLVNDAGASAVDVTVPTGPAGTSSRRIYRTEGGGSVYRFVTELRDNTTTLVTDTKADTELGDLPLDVATIGALAGATSLNVINAASFATAGWARVDSQIITWTNKSGNTLTGIPATGDGSLKSSISAGSGIVTVPMLTGVTGVAAPLLSGDLINLLVIRDDTPAQAALAAREGFGSGIIEYPISDSSLGATDATARADAELQLFAWPIGRLRYATRDTKTASGKRIHANLPSLGINGDFTIQSVAISEVGTAPTADPLYTVEASTIRFSLDDALRRLLRSAGGL